MIALPFIVQLIAPIVVSTVVDRLGKFGHETDWTQLKIDTDRKVRAIVPGELLDDAAVRFVNRQLDNVRTALLDSAELAKVLKMLADGRWLDAAQEIARHAFPEVALALVA